jgi:hypothetical protein
VDESRSAEKRLRIGGDYADRKAHFGPCFLEIITVSGEDGRRQIGNIQYLDLIGRLGIAWSAGGERVRGRIWHLI